MYDQVDRRELIKWFVKKSMRENMSIVYFCINKLYQARSARIE